FRLHYRHLNAVSQWPTLELVLQRSLRSGVEVSVGHMPVCHVRPFLRDNGRGCALVGPTV
ncbi:MAG: hypothetical protein ACI9TF_000824, partial [Paracrocinitomix sp.]